MNSYIIINLPVCFCVLFIAFFPLCIGISKTVPVKPLIVSDIIMGIVLCAAMIIITAIDDFLIRDFDVFCIFLAALMLLYFIPVFALYYCYRRRKNKKYVFKVHLLKTAVTAACFLPVVYYLLAAFIMVLY